MRKIGALANRTCLALRVKAGSKIEEKIGYRQFLERETGLPPALRLRRTSFAMLERLVGSHYVALAK